jgi:hypothetical protein
MKSTKSTKLKKAKGFLKTFVLFVAFVVGLAIASGRVTLAELSPTAHAGNPHAPGLH